MLNKPSIWLQTNAYPKKRLQLYDELHEELLKKQDDYKPIIIE